MTKLPNPKPSRSFKKVKKAAENKHKSEKLHLRGGKKPSSRTGLTDKRK